MDGRSCGGECFGRTIENRANENCGEICLLLEVQRIRDAWSIRISRPRFLGARHGSDVYDEGFRLGVRSSVARRGSEMAPALDERKVTRSYKGNQAVVL